MEREGFYHFGEMVNKFLTGLFYFYHALGTSTQGTAGNIAAYSEDDPLQAKPLQMFFTSVGRIGVISEFGNELSFSMTELQRNLNGVMKGPGDLTHAEYGFPVRVLFRC